MQYYRPGGSLFVGDPMPFFHDGTFHLYYLLDENHHQGKGGLGGHQWAHASTTDLRLWRHHPLALAIEHDWEASICTGSVFYHDGLYYAYYATRLPDWSEHLSLATSPDGVHFTKTSPNPFASPEPPYRPGPYRDPKVFGDEQTGLFHMLVTAELADYPLAGRGGCLAHLVSRDLRHWEHRGPFLVPGYVGHQPECADHFAWRGWYYLLFSDVGVTHYRMSRSPFGPWLRPSNDTFDCARASVFKTAAFTGDRRLAVAFLTSPAPRPWAGHTLFRELVQHENGTLGTRFPPEMIPEAATLLPWAPVALTEGVAPAGTAVELRAPQGMVVAALPRVPSNMRLTLRVEPQPGTASFGLCFQGSAGFETGHLLRFEPYRQKVSWLRPDTPSVSVFRPADTEEQERSAIYEVSGLDRPFDLDIVVTGDADIAGYNIVDVCVDQRRTLANRIGRLPGDSLQLFCHDGHVIFKDIQIRSIP